MPTEFILIPGRTAKQGTALNEGKYTDGYITEINTLKMNPDDMQQMGLESGDSVRMWNDVGEVTVPVESGKDELPPGLLVISYGDAWMPIGLRLRASIQDKMAELNSMAADAGRGPIPVTIYGVAPNPDVINSYVEAGVDAGIFWLPSVGEDEALKTLDGYAQIMATVSTAGA